MMRRFKSRSFFKKRKYSNKIILTLLVIIAFTCFFLYFFNKRVNDCLIDYASEEINKRTYNIVVNKINKEVLNKKSIEDILLVHKNTNDEILLVDFNLDKAYQVLDSVSDILTKSLNDNTQGSITYLNSDLTEEYNSLILDIPLGISFKSMFFLNYGPHIPVKINYVGALYTNLETKVTNYGLNNALVELFIYVEFQNKIIAPFKIKNQTFKYYSVIASKMIQGVVPNFYGGSITRESSIHTSKIEST